MAVGAPVNIVNFASAANATSTPITVGAAVTAGTFVVVTFVCSSRGATLGISDSKSNTWTTAGPFLSTNSGSATATLLAYTRLTSDWAASDTITVTNTVSGSVAVIVDAIPGVHTTSPIDVAAAGATDAVATTAWAAPSLTPAIGSLTYAFGNLGNSTTATSLAAGFTQGQKVTTTVVNVRTAFTMYQQNATSSSQTPTLTTGSVIWEACSVSFRAAPDLEILTPTPRYN